MKVFYLTCIYLLVNQLAIGQQAPGSPYTYFGIGDINNKGYSQQLVTGGTGIANRNALSLNNLNPASYSAMVYPYSFLSEFGVSMSIAQRTDEDNQGTQADMEFPYLGMIFKTGNKSGASLGLRQYSNVEYSIIGEDSFNGTSGTYRVLYDGNGGLNELYFGYGRSITDNFSLGGHLSYIFGTINNDQQLNSIDRSFDISIEDSNFLRGLKMDFGAHYIKTFNESSIVFGATYGVKSTLSSNRDLTIFETISGTDTPFDSLSSESIDSDDYVLPQSFGLGVTYNHQSRWQVSLDFQTHLWSATPLSGDDYELRDSRRLSIGFEKLPNYNNPKALGRLSYGFGIFNEESYLVLDNEGLNNVGFTAGLTVPLGARGFIRFIGERATRGSGLTDFFSESYTKLTLSFTFMDRWFQKRRYD